MKRPLALAAVLVLGLGSGGCTLCKPIIGAVTGPALILSHAGPDWGRCGCDGRAAAAVLVVAAAIGAAAGLVTGVISDVQALRGHAQDPTRNWWNPFATNTWDGG